MSEKQRWPLAEAERVGRLLADALQPFCERIEIAGSIRRRKETVSDIELLFIPRSELRAVDMFATAPVDLAAEELERWLAAGTIAKRLSAAGHPSWGQLNKLAIHELGIACDFFFEPEPLDWWRSLIIRTGPKELNIRLIESAKARGIGVHAYGIGLTDARGARVTCESEREFFKICGVPYIEPERRR